ncbi:undecaprenyl-phosphate glucose phosphotransferase [Oceanisphaera psychrotolerans]|uniref:Undecaprenyl-phosphate glucose phosphotransferase n=1 Tax=Oceanisphaera psychrotolerans TaxID=1414654 RepID=A0A1J4QE99_9GAMM|nr:undecaprenyl-phosphate glucose phosphotransferase [Oceanisphaera psychrotolerans]OIN07910.1 undecaprenyl-phosphate glucose phosphotransferase [Oceanisphaera psychrotolerans]
MSRTINGLTERYPAQLLVPLVDMLAVVAGSLLAHWWRFGHMQLPERSVLAMALMALLVVVFNSAFGGYRRWRIKRIPTLLFRLLLVWLLVAVLVTSIIYFAHAAHRYSRLWVGMALLLSFVMAGGVRIVVQQVLRHSRLKGLASKRVFLVGSGKKVLSVGRGMRNTPEEGYVLAGVERLRAKPGPQDLARIARRVSESGAQEVWLCMPLDLSNAIRDIFYALRHHTVEVRFIPNFSDMQLLNHRVSEVAGHFSIDLSVSPMSGMAWLVKRLEDMVVGALICLLISPICLAIAIAIKLTSPGPVLFKQYRTGANGRHFKVYKFRSMKVHQEHSGQVTQATKGDTRITPIGAFLRRTSLDELPQFFNVLQGRMSIVGPRPHALAHNEHYKELVESYMKRHKVKPGITGWAQVNGLRGETDTLDKMDKRVKHDLWYINNWSLWLDLRIIVATVFKGFINKNAY